MMKRIERACWAVVVLLAVLSMFPSAQTTIANNAAEMSGKLVMLADGAIARTVTNLFTFDRDPSAPFAVSSGSAKVSNLDADKVDGYEGLNLLDIGNCQFHLTLTTVTPYTSADVTAATSVFVTPTAGYQCAVWDGSSSWLPRTSTELTIAIAGFAANTNFDVWLYDNAGTLATETLAWSTDTARATALALQNGVYVKTGATTRRYVGTFRTTATIGQTEDSYARRYVYSYYNRRVRAMRYLEATDSWQYQTNTWRQARGVNGDGSPRLAFVQGVSERKIAAHVQAYASNGTVTQVASVAIGIDSTTAPTTGNVGMDGRMSSSSSVTPLSANYEDFVAAGFHYAAWLEIDTTASGTTTWLGDNGAPTILQSAIWGEIEQ